MIGGKSDWKIAEALKIYWNFSRSKGFQTMFDESQLPMQKKRGLEENASKFLERYS